MTSLGVAVLALSACARSPTSSDNPCATEIAADVKKPDGQVRYTSSHSAVTKWSDYGDGWVLTDYDWASGLCAYSVNPVCQGTCSLDD